MSVAVAHVMSEEAADSNQHRQKGRDGSFRSRHIGPRESDIKEMLALLGVGSLDELAKKTVPVTILEDAALPVPLAESEASALRSVRQLAEQNVVKRSLIGLGYADCFTPEVIKRTIFENPCWYTQYTPYQAEIAQGRLEALLNYQTVITDLTGLELANSSLLDDATAAAEAMTFCYRLKGSDERSKFFVSTRCHAHVRAVIETRAAPLPIEVVYGDLLDPALLDEQFFGVLLQYPDTEGAVVDPTDFVAAAKKQGAMVVALTDLLALTMLTPPGEWGADVAVGNSQRFGVPLGAGGPHAAFFATKEEFKREIPGRIVGVSQDASGSRALRLALQTREQHIRRERATSNICTAQVLLAIMAGMYATYHGPDGLQSIGKRVHELTKRLASALSALGFSIVHKAFFDTIIVETGEETAAILTRALKAGFNLGSVGDSAVRIALDECSNEAELNELLAAFGGKKKSSASSDFVADIPDSLQRTSRYLQHEVFNSYQSETELLRYITKLQGRDLSLAHSMIPLGSCTMKLNAAAEMAPVSWSEFSSLHPYAPKDQLIGYEKLVADMESYLSAITGFDAASVQPNSGAQGEYAGLLCIREFHLANGAENRNVCLIPVSAHGTNPASAIMAGMKVVKVACDSEGNIDLEDLKQRAAEHKDELAALMVTYPSTHGVFEEQIKEICEVIHSNGGQVYLDGANLNAQVGLCKPASFGADVCHINLHKTFCIPHGGGGPGVGPIAVKKHLAPYLPGSVHGEILKDRNTSGPVSAAPWGSASILPISWMYMRMMGPEGLKQASQVAILNANYIAKRLEGAYDVLYRGKQGMVAHECIIDLRAFKRSAGIEVEDIAKRLMDYGFHAPTISWPVIGTMMVEPTESESKAELDRFVEALLAIRDEIREIESGKADKANNVLKNAPHTAFMLAGDWDYPYSKERAVFPTADTRENKFWPPVRRIDNAYGDRNLFCSCA